MVTAASAIGPNGEVYFITERPNDNSTRIVVAQSLVNLGRRTEALRELEKVDVERGGGRPVCCAQRRRTRARALRGR